VQVKNSRFGGTGDTVPTHFSDPAPFGDFYAAATGADDELQETEQRRQERPRLVIEFIDTNARQQFITELITELKQPLPDRQPAWRHVALWSTGGALR
jgi:hypothetical protein